MQSPIVLHFLSMLLKVHTVGPLPLFSTLGLPWADLWLAREDSGPVLIQSYSHYLLHFELLECELDEVLSIDVEVKSPTILMFVKLTGTSTLTSKNGTLISETRGNSCTMSYLGKGLYKRTLAAGSHKMLVINFRADYFMREASMMPELKPLAEHFQTTLLPYYVLPHCPIAESIFSDLIKYIAFSERSKLDLNFHAFISMCLERYQKSLKQQHYTAITVHQQIGEKIRIYVLENYGDSSVDSIPKMAERFNVSVSLFKSITRNTFHKPFHSHVIEVRLNKALMLLITSKKTVYEVAFMVGYSDPAYFRQSFKKYHKLPPGILREFLL